MRAVLLTTLLLGISLYGFSQPGDPGGGDPDVPIGGIEILLAAGGLLGLRSILLGRRSRVDNEDKNL